MVTSLLHHKIISVRSTRIAGLHFKRSRCILVSTIPKEVMNIRKQMVVGALVALCSIGAYAQDASKAPGAGQNPFVECGIGAALFPDTHWAAVTSNVIWDLGTTAVTSATMSPQTCNGKKVATALFIRDSYEQLAEETAQGQGEHLATVLGMFDCTGAQQQAAAALTRQHMGSAVSQPGFGATPRIEKAARFYDAVQSAAVPSCANRKRTTLNSTHRSSSP